LLTLRPRDGALQKHGTPLHGVDDGVAPPVAAALKEAEALDPHIDVGSTSEIDLDEYVSLDAHSDVEIDHAHVYPGHSHHALHASSGGSTHQPLLHHEPLLHHGRGSPDYDDQVAFSSLQPMGSDADLEHFGPDIDLGHHPLDGATDLMSVEGVDAMLSEELGPTHRARYPHEHLDMGESEER
jgi:hypothetical protein